jgi:hypothetical protein
MTQHHLKHNSQQYINPQPKPQTAALGNVMTRNPQEESYVVIRVRI